MDPIRARLKARRRLAWSRAAFLLVAGPSAALVVLMVPINLATAELNWQFETAYPVVTHLVSWATFAAYARSLNYALAVLCFVVGAIIAWRRADDRVAWLAGAMLFLLPVGLSLGGYSDTWAYYPMPWRRIFLWAREGLSLLGIQVVILFVLFFPNGRPARPWLGWLYGLFAALQALLGVWQVLRGDEVIFTIWVASFGVVLPIQVGGLADRYRHRSTPLERQQIKWVLIGLSLLVCALSSSLALLIITENTPAAAGVALAGIHLQVFAVALLPVTIAFSVQRYRLWDIDRLVRRSLVYALVTAGLAGLYLVSVVVLQSVVRGATGQAQSTLVTVVSTLLIAAAAGPLRNRVQRGIDRRFNRQRYDAARTLADFSATVRDEAYADLDQLNTQLVGVVHDTLEPETVSLWLRSQT